MKHKHLASLLLDMNKMLTRSIMIYKHGICLLLLLALAIIKYSDVNLIYYELYLLEIIKNAQTIMF